MQPHVVFPIIIFAFGMGVFLSTFVGDISQDFNNTRINESNILTKNDLFSSLDNNKSSDVSNFDKKQSWSEQLQSYNKTDYHYPVTEVTMKIAIAIEKNVTAPTYSISTGYLEPYQNFCVNQVLNDLKGIKYRVVESGDKIKFIIDSQNKLTLDKIATELKYHDIDISRK